MTRTATAAQAKLTSFVNTLSEAQQLDAYAAIVDGSTADHKAAALIAGADPKTRAVITSYLRRAITDRRRTQLGQLPVGAVLAASERAQGTEPVGALNNLDAIIRDEWLEAHFPNAVEHALDATEDDEDDVAAYQRALLAEARRELNA